VQASAGLKDSKYAEQNLLGGSNPAYLQGGLRYVYGHARKAVAELKGEEVRDEIEPQIKLRLAALFLRSIS